MSVWFVRLKGHAFDLEFLGTQLRSAAYSVRKEQGDEYYLKSSHFDLLPDPRAVREYGEELIQRLNGIVKLESPSARPVSFGGDVMRVDDDGTRTISVFPPPISIRQAAVISVADDSSVRQPTTAEIWMVEAERDRTVARAIRLFGQEHTWDSLYKVLDAIKEAVGGESKLKTRQWVAASELKRFTQTANSVLAVGDVARHGHTKTPSPRTPMSLSDAIQLIRTLLIKLIQSRTHLLR
jgi:hypothetical protein